MHSYIAPVLYIVGVKWSALISFFYAQLVIPKFHGEKLHDIPDDQLSELLPVAKRIATASGAVDYNILQNNGTIAHQVVPHVCFPTTENL